METDGTTKRTVSIHTRMLAKNDDEDDVRMCLRSADGRELSTSSDCRGYLAAMPIPVDDDETFVKNIDDNNDDNDLSTADRYAPEKRTLMVAQHPQEENTDIRSIEHNPKVWIDADVHVNLSHMPPLLSEHPANDDSGRFLPNGGKSMSMQYQKGNVDTNDPLPDSTVVEESEDFLSDKNDPNRLL
ncbi:uncharacterized protein LOC127723526 [Mytilus californianus]|uniref:uncharacterized protein LOC127723526 n=1 Tax=Mytilus californianus TaxID=6549 RepID=UPI0022479D62|nr:uncharacterized protein LOC127723526 [Mytilus californianus]